MPEYNGVVNNNRIEYTEPNKAEKWLMKYQGRWVKAKYDLIETAEDRKSGGQLGYFFGLLVPQTYYQLYREGNTMPITYLDITRQIPITKDAAYELLTVLCGRVGDNGEALRVSDMNHAQMRKFLDNVLGFMVADLGMNETKLKAWRKK